MAIVVPWVCQKVLLKALPAIGVTTHPLTVTGAKPKQPKARTLALLRCVLCCTGQGGRTGFNRRFSSLGERKIQDMRVTSDKIHGMKTANRGDLK